jgi:hypothetical protein
MHFGSSHTMASAMLPPHSAALVTRRLRPALRYVAISQSIRAALILASRFKHGWPASSYIFLSIFKPENGNWKQPIAAQPLPLQCRATLARYSSIQSLRTAHALQQQA